MRCHSEIPESNASNSSPKHILTNRFGTKPNNHEFVGKFLIALFQGIEHLFLERIRNWWAIYSTPVNGNWLWGCILIRFPFFIWPFPLFLIENFGWLQKRSNDSKVWGSVISKSAWKICLLFSVGNFRE